MAGRRSVLEKEIERTILDFLNMHSNVWARKQNTTGIWDPTKKVFRKNKGYAEIGVSDIQILVRTETGCDFGAIEVKTPEYAEQLIRKHGFPATPDQWAFIEKVKAYGGFGGVAWTLEMAIEICEGRL